jgi:hypothetical protein|tara:strand:+ start:15715 stop:15873 length:159 start_codon:yes stop_codon:yes gene_type:complete
MRAFSQIQGGFQAGCILPAGNANLSATQHADTLFVLVAFVSIPQSAKSAKPL